MIIIYKFSGRLLFIFSSLSLRARRFFLASQKGELTLHVNKTAKVIPEKFFHATHLSVCPRVHLIPHRFRRLHPTSRDRRPSRSAKSIRFRQAGSYLPFPLNSQHRQENMFALQIRQWEDLPWWIRSSLLVFILLFNIPDSCFVCLTLQSVFRTSHRSSIPEDSCLKSPEPEVHLLYIVSTFRPDFWLVTFNSLLVHTSRNIFISSHILYACQKCSSLFYARSVLRLSQRHRPFRRSRSRLNHLRSS